jgi:hypothetical protein
MALLSAPSRLAVLFAALARRRATLWYWRAVGLLLTLDHDGMRNWLSDGATLCLGGPVGTGGRPCRLGEEEPSLFRGAGPRRDETPAVDGGDGAGAVERAGGEYGGTGSGLGTVEW